MGTLFFIFVFITAFSLTATFFNMVKPFFKNDIKAYEAKSFVVYSFVFGLLYVLGGLGALITGIIWIVQQLA